MIFSSGSKTKKSEEVTVEYPSEEVFDAFGIRHELATGIEERKQAILSQNYVFKPAEDPVATNWICEVLNSLAPSEDFRVAKPLRASTGEWIAHGFTCQTRLAGEHDMHRWDDVLAASTAFHLALAAIEKPQWIGGPPDFFQCCDRFAWEDEPVAVDSRSVETIAQLRSLVRPVQMSSQLIHGDLAGNVLFAPNELPAIIDFTPYWRPALHADGIVIVDAISVRGASPSKLIDDFLERPNGLQALLRSALFRAAVYGNEQLYDHFFPGFQTFVDAFFQRIE